MTDKNTYYLFHYPSFIILYGLVQERAPHYENDTVAKHMIRRDAGASFIETLLFAAIVGAAMYFAAANYLQTQTLQAETKAAEGLNTTRKLIQLSLRDDTSWRNTVADLSNTVLMCVRNASDCRDQSGAIQVRDALNNLLNAELDPQTGFDLKGERCALFNLATPDHSCIFRYEVIWTPICPSSGACTNPLHSFRVNLQVAGTRKFNYLEVTNFSFNLFRSAPLNYLQESCRVFSGTYRIGSRECILPKAGLCPSGFVLKATYVEGPDEFKVCKAVQGNCPPGQSASGIDANGMLICS